jgi:spore coat protein U-like protein
MRISTIVLLLCLSSLAWPVNRAEAFKCDVTATGVNFGGYDVFSSVPRDSTGTITVTCNNPDNTDKKNPNEDIQVEISLSTGNSGSFSPRQMQSATGDALSYNLYATPFSTILGDGGGSSSVITGFVNKDMPWNVTIYGSIPARQNVRAGSYSDTITVTIDF